MKKKITSIYLGHGVEPTEGFRNKLTEVLNKAGYEVCIAHNNMCQKVHS